MGLRQNVLRSRLRTTKLQNSQTDLTRSCMAQEHLKYTPWRREAFFSLICLLSLGFATGCFSLYICVLSPRFHQLVKENRSRQTLKTQSPPTSSFTPPSLVFPKTPSTQSRTAVPRDADTAMTLTLLWWRDASQLLHISVGSSVPFFQSPTYMCVYIYIHTYVNSPVYRLIYRLDSIY